jgi:cytochrome c biogenesis protein CcdA
MDILIFICWGLIFLATPISFLITGIISFHAGQNIINVLAKELFGFTYYFIATLTSMFVLRELLMPTLHGELLSPWEEFIYVFALVCYGISGWLLCSFIKGTFINPFTNFFYKEKSHSLMKETHTN